jgi:1-deoxy-D-xylulose-5-phosphate reductoisomerase
MAQVKKRVILLGSTGSIGQNSLAVLESLNSSYELVAASSHRQWQELARQARKYQLAQVVISDTSHYQNLKSDLAEHPTDVLAGQEHLIDLVQDGNYDILIVAIVGAAALPAVIAAITAGKTVAIANKESLVMAGCLLMPLAIKNGATILPIDSEHSAILQAMHSGNRDEVEKITLTCSGGPFRTWATEKMAGVTPDQALNHPTWDMGPKISIDSATMMNKALEIVEARWLFDLSGQEIEVIIHPESIIHSMVEFCDGSTMAQLSRPDMKLPIQYALTHPNRLPGSAERLDLHKLGQLTFEPPDMERFPALRLGFEVAERGGTSGSVLNAANEVAVDAFRAGRIGFTQIVELTERCLRKDDWVESPDLEQIYQADRSARQEVENCLKKI